MKALIRAEYGDNAFGRGCLAARRLIEVIQPAVLDDIGGVSPRQGWIPLELVRDWMTATLNEHYGAVGNLTAPGRGVNMGDGWETRRRREPGCPWRR